MYQYQLDVSESVTIFCPHVIFVEQHLVVSIDMPSADFDEYYGSYSFSLLDSLVYKHDSLVVNTLGG